MKYIRRKCCEELYRLAFFGVLTIAIEFFNSCAPMFKSESGISDIYLEHKKNGYLIELQGSRSVKNVAAFISTDNWLVITLVDSDVDFDRLRSWQPEGPISDVEVVGYRTSVQLTLKLKEKFRRCELVPEGESKNIQIALFSQ